MSAGRAAWLWLPPLAWMALLFHLSSMGRPPRTGPDVPAHFAAYAVLGALLARAVAGGGSRAGRGAAAAAAGIGALYGVTDEVHQSFVPGRTAEVKDALVDALGSAAGGAAMAALGRRLRAGSGRRA